MDMKSIALAMYPSWLLGAFMIWATIQAGYGKFVRIQKRSVIKWIIFLCVITLFRVFTIRYMLELDHMKESAKGVLLIPWPATLTVFWEDAAHGLPLFLLYLWSRASKFKMVLWYCLLAMVTLSFGSGHTYQGYWAAALLMLYIPYSIKLGAKHGFGTVMVCHTLYDLFTILTVKWALGG